MKIIIYVVLLVVIGMLVTGCSSHNRGEVISFESELAALTNVSLFAISPCGRTGMVSSYDRSGGNNDWGGGSRVDKDGFITVAELNGPGVIHRIWLTGFKTGQELFIFIDGEKKARIQGDVRELLTGDFSVFKRPLVDTRSGSRIWYLPIPFSKSIRVAISKPVGSDPRPYYQMNYELFDKSVAVKSYPKEFSNSEKSLIEEVKKVWGNNKSRFVKAKEVCGEAGSLSIAPGQVQDIINVDDTGQISSFCIKINGLDDYNPVKKNQLLRTLVLRAYWDGSELPSVEVPLGDFFANAFRFRRYTSLPLANIDNTFICRFPMPFLSGARITLENQDSVPVEISVSADVKNGLVNNDINYFYANWNSSVSPRKPHVVVSATGKGHLVGCYLTSFSYDGSWYILEGDESIYRDGEFSPSIHGTGLEDYFNGGWYYNGMYDEPLAGLLEKAAMRTMQYRFHLPDRISFNKGVRFEFEFGHANKSPGYISSVGYWYQDTPRGLSRKLSSCAKRLVPIEKVEIASLMSCIIELERDGLWNEAANASAYYGEVMKSSERGELLKLRSLAYNDCERTVVSNYWQYAFSSKFPAVKQQAQTLEWYHVAKTNALLGIQASGHCTVYIDGVKISQSDNPAGLDVIRLPLAPGKHSLALSITPTRRDAYFQLYLRNHAGDIALTAASDGNREAKAWKCSRTRPVGWPSTLDLDARYWKENVAAGFFHPNMSHWQFTPNIYPKMQSGGYVGRLWKNWQNGKDTAYLWREFEIK